MEWVYQPILGGMASWCFNYWKIAVLQAHSFVDLLFFFFWKIVKMWRKCGILCSFRHFSNNFLQVKMALKINRWIDCVFRLESIELTDTACFKLLFLFSFHGYDHDNWFSYHLVGGPLAMSSCPHGPPRWTTRWPTGPADLLAVTVGAFTIHFFDTVVSKWVHTFIIYNPYIFLQ